VNASTYHTPCFIVQEYGVFWEFLLEILVS
jgi:hypothetical protein